MILNTLLFTDDQVLITKSEDELQWALYNLPKTVSVFDMSISVEKTKITTFSGKICRNNKML
jgi:hypothetical protein